PFVLIGPLPPLTLAICPYTTLFRSRLLALQHRGRHGAGALPDPGACAMKDFFAAGGEFLAMGGYAFFVWGSYAVSAALIALEVVDRKSTRLNSSHVKISYAVFCLKK